MTRSPFWTTILLAALVAAPALALVPATAAAQAPDTLTLRQVLESALETHPALAAAEARRATAAASIGEARAARLPSVAAGLGATQHQEPMVVAPLHGFDPTAPPSFDETLYQGHASLNYTLFDGGERGARIRTSESQAAAAEAGLEAMRSQVLAEAASAYLTALTAREILAAHDQQVSAFEAEVDRTRLFFREGRTARVAVLRTEAALSRARAEREASRESLRLALRRLARVGGLDANGVSAAVLRGVAPDVDDLPGRDRLVDRALAGNPGLTQAATRVEAAELGLAAARSSFLPRVSLMGRYTLFGAASVDPTAEWQAGVQLSYPIFAGGARAAGVEAAAARADEARAERRSAEERVADAVDVALLALESARARVRALEAAVEQSEEVARIEALALESGAGVQTDYLRAEADLLQARSALAEARHGVLEARVRLAQATGSLTLEWLSERTEGVDR